MTTSPLTLSFLSNLVPGLPEPDLVSAHSVLEAYRSHAVKHFVWFVFLCYRMF